MDGCTEAPVLLALECQCLTVVEHHLIDLGPLEGGEDVILVGMHELVAGRHDIVGGGEGEGALRELAWQVVFLVKRPDNTAGIVVLLRLPTTGNIAAQEEIGIEVGGGLGRNAGTHTINEITGEHGVDGANIDLRGMILVETGLNKVLNKGLGYPDDVLEALDILETVDELIHAGLALGELDLTVLFPEIVASHHGVDIAYLFLLTLEKLWRQGIESIVGETGIANDGKFLKEAGHDEFGEHIVDGESPRAIGQTGKLLDNLHILNEVDVALLGDGELAALNLVTAIGKDIEIATETEVLLVVGQEIEVETLVAVHIDGVLDVEAVEGDGVLADGRCEGILQQTYLVIVDVDVGKYLLHEGIENVACLYEVTNACGVLTFNDGLLIVGLTAIDVLCDGLVNGNGQDEFVIPRAGLNLIDEPLLFLSFRPLQLLGSYLVGCQSEFLVLIILVIVAQ